MTTCLAPLAAALNTAHADGTEMRLLGSEEATLQVALFHHAILDILKRSEALGYEGRVGELRPIVDKAMNMKIFGARAIGRSTWSTWSTEQRQAYLIVYKEYVYASYAARFSGFSGQEFVTVGSHRGPRGQIIVATEVRQPHDRPIRLNYVMRNDGGKWGIVDIYLDSTISEVALRRSEFSAVLRRGGFDNLIEAIQTKTGHPTTQD